jgi:hypothetical protein
LKIILLRVVGERHLVLLETRRSARRVEEAKVWPLGDQVRGVVKVIADGIALGLQGILWKAICKKECSEK